VTAARRGRRTAGVLTIAALLAAAAAVALSVRPGRPGGPPRAGSPPGPPPITSQTPVPAPARGAYVGAWVDPAMYGQHGHIGAVDALQQEIGRRLDIVHIYLRPDAAFPTSSDRAFVRQGSTLLISWALNDSRAIAAGTWDASIRQRARELKALGRPVLLEWRWEMDRPNLRAMVGSPADYIAAWKHIRLIFAGQHVTNVAWVWCPTARGFADGTAQAYFPGDGDVNWICADAYPQPGPRRSFTDVVRPFLAWAARHPKPVMIGEFGVPQSYGAPDRAAWLRGAEQTVLRHPQIKALVYFDSDAVGPAPQTRYGLSAGPLAVFRAIADDRYFNPRGLPVRRG
jgi:hypothetical protein